MTLEVINHPATLWANKSDTAFPALLKYGYTLFVKDGTTDKFKRVIYANGQPQSSSEVGYAFVQEVPPNAGFSNTGNTVIGIIHEDFEYNKKTFDEIKAIPIIPAGQVEIENQGDIITDWKNLSE